MQKLIRVGFSGMQYQIGSDQLILGQIFKASIFNIIMKIIRLFDTVSYVSNSYWCSTKIRHIQIRQEKIFCVSKLMWDLPLG